MHRIEWFPARQLREFKEVNPESSLTKNAKT